jgi:hypothetical protein
MKFVFSFPFYGGNQYTSGVTLMKSYVQIDQPENFHMLRITNTVTVRHSEVFSGKINIIRIYSNQKCIGIDHKIVLLTFIIWK